MGFILTLPAVLGLIVGIMAFSSTAGAMTVSEVNIGNHAFCKNMFEQLRFHQGNVFFSPLSLELALCMVYAGAEGNTAKQIREALMLPESKEKVYESVKAAMKSFSKSGKTTLNLANGLFIHENTKLKVPFLSVVKKYFDAEISQVNFSKDGAIEAINKFVSNKTAGKIPELFERGSLDDLTRLVLVNAIYFKGNWASKFDRDSTFEGIFHVSKTKTVSTDFMSSSRRFRTGYPEGLNAAVVILPYQENDMSMVLIIPNEIDGLKAVEEKLFTYDFEKLVNSTDNIDVHLTMPKFKISQSMNLESLLVALGMTEMFSDSANFKGITDDPLYVSKAVQKAFIEVNEEGSEAAAATGIGIALRSAPLPPRVIEANRPFLFVIKSASGSVLFMGRLTEIPQNSE